MAIYNSQILMDDMELLYHPHKFSQATIVINETSVHSLLILLAYLCACLI